MRARIASFLQIRPGESRLVALIAALFALIDAARGFGPNAVDALFFRRFGVENLPYMYMGLGLLNFVVMLAYTAGLARFDRRRFFVGLIGVLALVLLAERAAVWLDSPVLWPVLWLTIRMLSATLGTFMWHLAGDVTDTRQAKRLFSLFTSASIAGSVVGNLLTGPLANALGTDNLLLVYAGVLAGCLVLTRRITREFFQADARQKSTGFIENIRIGFDTVRGSSLLGLMALSSVLFSVLYFSISFLFSEAVAENIGDEAAIAGFLGLFTSIATAVTLLVSLLLANRIYVRIGLVNAVFTLPVTYVGSFVLLFASFSLPSAIAVRLSQQVLLGGVASTAWATFYNVVPSDRRGQVRTFDFGVPAQVGTVLSGALLILGQTILQRQQIFVIGFAVAGLCSFLVWRMRRGYGEALVAALRAGRFEVFTADKRAFAGYRGDAAAIRVALDALEDENPTTRRLAIEILGLLEARSTAHAIIDALDDPDPEVRVAAAETLVDIDLHGSAPALVSTLLDEGPDPNVTAVALEALPRVLDSATPTLVERLDVLQRDDDMGPHVHARAAAALTAFGEQARAEATWSTLLADPDPTTRIAGVEALGDAAKTSDATQPALAEQVVGALQDTDANVRQAACRALAQMSAEIAVEPLAQSLGDDDPLVRGSAAKSLRGFGPAATQRVLTALKNAGPHTLEAVLDALNPADPTIVGPLRAHAREEIARIEAWHTLANAIPLEESDSRAARLLCDLLAKRIEDGTQRLLKVLGLLGNPASMALVGQGLRATDAEMRAVAIEALETLGDNDLAGAVVTLLEDVRAANGDTVSPEVALRRLLDEGGWMQAVAARAAADMGLGRLEPDLRVLEARAKYENRMAWEAARDALTRLGETFEMETLHTVSMLERVMLLREIPLFSDLSPQDLKGIADVAREELYFDGADIVREGEQGDEMYVIVSGHVRILKEADVQAKEFARRGPGDFVGEMAVIESQPRFATVRTEGTVRVLVLDADAFDAILRDRPQVARALVGSLSHRLRELG